MIVLTNLCMHQQRWQPSQTGIKSLSSREKGEGCREAMEKGGNCKAGEGGALQSWCGKPKFGRAGGMVGMEGGQLQRRERGLAELGVMNDVQQLFVASSIMAHFSLELEFNCS